MAEKRIFIVGDINDEAYREFSEQLREAEFTKYKVVVELSSGGGDSYAALAFYTRIRSSCKPITVEAYGYVASAAVLILAAGHDRRIAKDSWVMVHEDTISELSGDVTALERETRQYRNLENQWNDLLAKHTITSADEWARMHKATTYLTANQCLALGLVNEVI